MDLSDSLIIRFLQQKTNLKRETTMLPLEIEPNIEAIEQFYDTREELSSVCDDSCPISPVTCLAGPPSPIVQDPNVVSPSPYKRWIGAPLSIEDRRMEFKKQMCLTPTPRSTPLTTGEEISSQKNDADSIRTSSATAGTPNIPTWSSNDDVSEKRKTHHPSPSLLHKIANWDDNADAYINLGSRGGVDGGEGRSRRFGDLVSDQMHVADGIPKAMMPPDYVGSLLRREDNGSVASRASAISTSSSNESIGSRRKKWLKRLGIMACIMDGEHEEEEDGRFNSYDINVDGGNNSNKNEAAVRVKVHLFWKRSGEFSAVFKEQDFSAHQGAIWAMKLSPDGRYLASGGEDGVVRVWSVMECPRGGGGDDGGGAFDVEKKGGGRTNIIGKKKNGHSAGRVVVPQQVFRLSEQPLHQFHGHNGDILDLSWSKDKYLISSSLDKTVRLWQVGCESCLRVFRHNNYVTCVQFNPTDENFFASGSIDGLIRVWDISSCHVADWSDMTELVTAVCFKPDGKGVVVGSITGNCRFFNITDNRLQVDRDVSLHKKKGSTFKRITGLQFSQSDHTKLLVTSADSQIRILDKYFVVHKYKGFRNSGSLISASFTKDGRHIVSASEDSSVFIWSHHNKNTPPLNRAKISRSYERFFSNEASVAIPWLGFTASSSSQSEDFTFQIEGRIESRLHANNNEELGSSLCSNSNPGSSLESSRKGNSITCPEKDMLECRRIASSPNSWGEVIITAGCDGRVRVFCNYGLPIHG